MNPAPPPSTLAEARPTDSGERLLLLDTLRGFALCGVFISNTFVWFSGRVFLPRAQLEALFANGTVIDKVLLPIVSMLVTGRFITIFSFLFGLGFAVQLGRAEARGASVTGLYGRRLGVLFGIGICHLVLIWYGDILSSYALLGGWLLLFRKRADRTVLWWALGLVFGGPLVVAFIQKMPQLLAATPEAAAALTKAEMERSAALKAELLPTFQTGSWWAIVKAGLAFYKSEFLLVMGFNLPVIFGRFLLGYYAGRRRLFHDAEQHIVFFRRLFFWALGLGIVTSGVGAVMQQLFIRKILNPETLPTWVPFAMQPIRTMGEVAIAATYVSGITLLFQKAAWQKLLVLLAPVGRMALTNYLCQSIISVLVFNGFGLGLFGTMRPFMTVLYCLGIFSAQILVSHLWLARFRFGPAEWVWRSLTYGKAQPMRKEMGPAEPALAP
ncbi:DUF418 domain-containing protein [Myxococcus landrumensis]|uniref:DUF418 domain-containing protein n=1 Tax=Myxococcus landrumensis TaxID=2813577 RepID=A0ABX7NB82_9BACT|nr:DUF418 domain-containing protein [Myxococcus landrumus]QSQ16052.1 DUF418 domain-containing protein [Myxococcus landrumus]